MAFLTRGRTGRQLPHLAHQWGLIHQINLGARERIHRQAN